MSQNIYMKCVISEKCLHAENSAKGECTLGPTAPPVCGSASGGLEHLCVCTDCLTGPLSPLSDPSVQNPSF